MGWTKKISTKKYALGTIANLVLAIYVGLPNPATSWWLSFVIISAALNHYFTIKALGGLVETKAQSGSVVGGAKILFYVVFKTLFLVSGFACLLVYSPDKVLQGLLIYIFQLIILGLSIKNMEKFFKKGPHT